MLSGYQHVLYKGIVVAFLALATLSQTATGEGDFFILVRQFGPTFCDDQNCSVEPFSAFTLHGLWPNYDDGSYPSYCDDSNKFSTKNLEKSTLNAMDCEWLSLTNSNQGFWSHEWSKHGTCALDLLPTQEDYFQKALELNGIYDVNVAFETAGISLSDASSQSTDELENVLNDAWGAESRVTCSDGALLEVWTCINEDFEIFDCPSSVRTKCSKTSSIPGGDDVPASCDAYFPDDASSSSSSLSSSTTSSACATVNIASIIMSTALLLLLVVFMC